MSKNKAILIIDDEFIILESLRIQISRILPDSILLEAASSGDESIQLIDDFYYSGHELALVISDYHLDDAKGTDILKHAISKFPEVQKVILTGQADTEQINDFKTHYGLDGLFTKPWDFVDIKNIILPILN